VPTEHLLILLGFTLIPHRLLTLLLIEIFAKLIDDHMGLVPRKYMALAKFLELNFREWSRKQQCVIVYVLCFYVAFAGEI